MSEDPDENDSNSPPLSSLSSLSFLSFFDSIFEFIFDLGGVTVCVCVKVGEVGEVGDDAMDAYWRSLPGWM